MNDDVKRFCVWEIISFAWTEIGIEDDECSYLADKAGIRRVHLDAVDRIIFRDVCASFALDSILVIPFWMLMPDWGYSEEYLRKRMERWYARPYWMHFLNPIRWFGYPIAVLMSSKYRTMLRRVAK